ncbi:threonine/serine exporter family protein [Athalassotoga saccharophila]|uniref:threonine/serine exporter family protein n=1 Tax=Athalassotoga saccharophila TaxID=1441386 RepID=UPI001379A5EE|nr:threonine/serine exporter family protein [Athalassotoga saccharophila]BBJ27723.1 hypothetical protein ATHSA_0612 [Athalassotoga saccharophila]
MNIILNSIIAGVASGSFTILYNARFSDAIIAGGIGAIGWYVYSILIGYGMLTATLISAFTIGIIGRIVSRIRHMPSQPLIVGGIVVLVPGFMAFKAMNAFIVGKNTEGTTLMLNTFLTAAAIGTGLIVAVAITAIIFRIKIRR